MAAVERLTGSRTYFLNAGLGPRSEQVAAERGARLYNFVCTTGHDVVRNKVVLDVGCYRGGGVRMLATSLGAAKVVGIDFVARWVEECQAIHADVAGTSFIHAEAIQVAEVFEAESFDTV